VDGLPGDLELLNLGESGDERDLILHGHLEQAAGESSNVVR
jgi:hypothetical protein